MKKWMKNHKVVPKALALLIAIVLWIYVVTIVDPIGERTISDIKPTYYGGEELYNTLDLRVGNTLDNLVEIKLKGSRHELATIDESDIKIEVDISKLREAGEYELSYKVVLPSDDVSVVKRKPEKLKIKLDKNTAKTIDIDVNLDCSFAEGYIGGEASTIPSVLSVTGLAEEVNQIDHAEVSISKKELNTSINQTVAYTLHDAEGNVLDLKSIKIENSTVDVIYPVYKTETIKLAVELIEGGGVKKKNVSCNISPKEITIAADEKRLNELKAEHGGSLIIGSINLADYHIDDEIPAKLLQMPDGVQNLSNVKEAKIDIDITGLSYRSIETDRIEIINIPYGYTVEPVTEKIAVRVRGNEENVAKVMPKNVRIVVDLAGRSFSAAEHMVNGEVYIDGVGNVGAIGDYEVVIKVSKLGVQ